MKPRGRPNLYKYHFPSGVGEWKEKYPNFFFLVLILKSYF